MSVPPGVSERDFERAVARFRSVVGSEWVFSSDEDVALYRDAYSPFWGEAEEKVGVGRRGADLRRAGAGDRQHREPVPHSALSDLHRPQPGLRRLGAGVLGQRRARSEAHEPHPRRRRAQRLRARRARRQLLRSLPSLARSKIPSSGSTARIPGWGSVDRQRARPRRRLHDESVPRSLRRALRHGGRARRRRARAHRHGRAARVARPGSSSSTASGPWSTASSRSRTSAS